MITCACTHPWADHAPTTGGKRDCQVEGCDCRGMPLGPILRARGWIEVTSTGKGFMFIHPMGPPTKED